MPGNLPLRIVVLVFAFAGLSCRQETGEGGEAVNQAETRAPVEAVAASGSPLALNAGETQVVDEVLRRAALKQAAGLGEGTVRVNGAWAYTGYSTLSAVDGARLVAVDVTVEGHTPDFDLDDIEIVDGTAHISYGSDPHITLLNDEGRPVQLAGGAAPEIPKAPEATRLLLIYGFPENSPSFHLVYWGKALTREPVVVAAEGWGLSGP